MVQIKAILLDIDGTLIDDNDAHTHAWLDAMGEQGYNNVSFEKIRPLIGMGGDKVLPEVLQIDKDSEQGQRISERRKEIFQQRYLPQVSAFPKTYELLKQMYDRGLKLVIATSATQQEMQGLLAKIGPDVQNLLTQEASDKDTSKSKPDSDIVSVALQKIGCQGHEALMLGDTPYDIEAASKDHVGTIAFRSGGWKDKDLAGAVAVYNDPADLLANYDTSPLVKEITIPNVANTHIGA